MVWIWPSFHSYCMLFHENQIVFPQAVLTAIANSGSPGPVSRSRRTGKSPTANVVAIISSWRLGVTERHPFSSSLMCVLWAVVTPLSNVQSISLSMRICLNLYNPCLISSIFQTDTLIKYWMHVSHSMCHNFISQEWQHHKMCYSNNNFLNLSGTLCKYVYL